MVARIVDESGPEGPRPAVAIRVLVADDQQPLRQAIRDLITNDPEMTVVATAADSVEGVELARETAPDVARLDVKLPGGVGRGKDGSEFRSIISHSAIETGDTRLLPAFVRDIAERQAADDLQRSLAKRRALLEHLVSAAEEGASGSPPTSTTTRFRRSPRPASGCRSSATTSTIRSSSNCSGISTPLGGLPQGPESLTGG